MSAVVGVLNQSLTESIKGFYKLRKAYVTLNGILEAEARFMQKRAGLANGNLSRQSVESLRSNRSAPSIKRSPGAFEEDNLPSKSPSFQAGSPLLNSKQENTGNGADDDEDDEFYDVDESHDSEEKPTTYNGNVELNGVAGNLKGLSIDSGGTSNHKIQRAIRRATRSIRWCTTGV